MIDKDRAKVLVTKWINDRSDDCRGQLLVVDSFTIETPFGWVFFYNHRKWVEEKDEDFRIMGNEPVVIERSDGSIRDLPRGGTIEQRIAAYEASRREG